MGVGGTGVAVGCGGDVGAGVLVGWGADVGVLQENWVVGVNGE